MHRLLDYWRDEFDWRAQERRLNRLPQFTATRSGWRPGSPRNSSVGPTTTAISKGSCRSTGC
ncbi:epoxide hydrolase N-terminal domain-containing protein [Mesorhizobium sp. WSM2239]|uniref:Epoxide hydrolase N-terminal domain-containing protein n=2 Tax=unclassified Mesorhizobium TaxID=325217 RepID=A0AAU8D531_9HYPH